MLSISFLGDISLNDSYIELYKKGVNPFGEIESLLSSFDFVAGNLECMTAGDKGENILKQPRLTTSIETLNYLNKIRLKIAFLAQNHVYDHLEDGFKKTTNFLTNHGISYLGAGYTLEEAAEPFVLTKDSISVAILNYVTRDTNPNIPDSAGIIVNMFDLDNCIHDIQKLKKKVNHIVLSLHWGGRVEGGLFPDWDQPKLARKLIDAGADLIIGHHSHTFQPYEKYKGKYIFYSLGNFCFSDYWFNGELNIMPKRRMISTIVGITFNATNYSVQTSHFSNNRVTLSKHDSYSNKVNLRNHIFKVIKSNKATWNIYYFHKQIILPFVLFFGRTDISFVAKLGRLNKYVRKKLIKPNR
jgi:hypothetical protein